MRSSVSPAIIVGLLGLVGLVLFALQFSVTIEQVEPEAPLASPTPAAPLSNPTAGQNTSNAPTAGTGALRISNQTDQPVRVALLAKRSPTAYREEPAHWDFAPQEGSTQGLLLSLPEGNLKLNRGDVLVGWAQDGSGRYWGPYVVGETAVPIWNNQAKEWELTLK